MPRVQRQASEFRSICTQLGYRKRHVNIVSATSVTLQNLNWDGGSRNEYSAVDLREGTVKRSPNLGMAHPMENEYEGAKIAMRKDVIILQHGTFMGKPATMTIFCHPDNFPYLIGE